MKNNTQGQISPIANSDAVVSGEKYRITVLTSKLIRFEYNENGIFKDNATFAVINRNFDVPFFLVTDGDKKIKLVTDDVTVVYDKNLPFSQETLKLYYNDERRSIYAGRYLPDWRYGVTLPTNMKGTAVALDGVNGECELGDGVISRGEICILDDSNSRMFDNDGNIVSDTFNETDIYAFCYGLANEKEYDYEGALGSFYRLCGQTPMLPRYALGNWWCRYHKYSSEEYLDLFKKFEDEDIPFSVSVLDMDWHYTDIDKKYGGGWTGSTWNDELFPNHIDFLKKLHDMDLHVCLNLHPQGGIAPHEAGYKELAEAMSVNADSGEIVEFEPENPYFLKKHFEIIYNALEKEGVDFWWLDYNTQLRELEPDPLPVLNAYHYTDNCKSGKRGMLLSRYAGTGSHRYPVGFSGDAFNTWEMLAFEPYFTATASNIGYGWWSHDIGGFQGGKKDDELMARWVQFGVFSPIMRLHCTNLRYMSKEPWCYGRECEEIMKKFLRLRHKLIPYLYTMNYRASEKNMPLVCPMYAKYGGDDAHAVKTEYLFGTELIVSPIVKPRDSKTNMGYADVYLPDGEFYDFFTGIRYSGGKIFRAYRSLDTMPVFAKAGAIVPMTSDVSNGTDNPGKVKIRVFAGESNSFVMYEDDGISYNYKDGDFALTEMNLKWGKSPVFTIDARDETKKFIPENRRYIIEFVGIENCEVVAQSNAAALNFKKSYADGVLTVEILSAVKTITVTLLSCTLKKNDTLHNIDVFLGNAAIEYSLKEKLYNVMKSDIPDAKKLSYTDYNVDDDNVRHALTELLTCDI